jgi:hypothetical protein
MAPSPRRTGAAAVLRAFVAALVVANVVYFAYASGALDGAFGLHAAGEREPERLSNQVRPQTIRLLPRSAGSPASAPVEEMSCWETPAFGPAEAPAVEATLASTLPAGSWTDTRGERIVGARTETTHTYRVNTADGALAARLTLLRLDASGRGFSPCAKSERPR